MRGIALEAPHIVEPLGQFYVDLLLASATRVPMPLLVKIAWLVAWMIVMLSGHLLLAILVAMAMLIQVARCMARMIVMFAGFFFCHHLLLMLRSAGENAAVKPSFRPRNHEAARRLKRTTHRTPLMVEKRSISKCLEAAASGLHDSNQRH